MLLEERLEPIFHPDCQRLSSGAQCPRRPGRGPEAVLGKGLGRINEHLVRWAMQKFKRFRRKFAKATEWLQQVYLHQPALFAHWQLVAFTARWTVEVG